MTSGRFIGQREMRVRAESDDDELSGFALMVFAVLGCLFWVLVAIAMVFVWRIVAPGPPDVTSTEVMVGEPISPAEDGRVELLDVGGPNPWWSTAEIKAYVNALPVDEEVSSIGPIERAPEGIVVTNPPEAPVEGDWSVWDRLAACESGDRNIPGSADWHINTGNGHSGGLQWVHDTWVRAGGQEYTEFAWQATREQEIAVAEAWLARTSWAQWPACSRWLGLR